jgi:transposase
MATERLSMRNVREILRLKWVLGRSHREAARSLGISAGTVASTTTRAREVGLDWAQVEALDDDALEQRVYGPHVAGGAQRPLPDCAELHVERRKPGVTLQLLHLEYLEKHPNGFRYTQFCDVYRRWLKRRGLVMRQVHRAGEKLFTDYAGKRPHIFDPQTGEEIPVELFVAVLGASNYTFAEATRTQQQAEWIASHTRALEFFGGVPGAVVPDQLRSAVSSPCRYEPEIARAFADWSAHYGTTVLPARPAHPRDKAKAEVGVQVAERWIVARVRHERHFSLDSLNTRMAELLEELNDRPMRLYGASRRQLFERLDRPALRPLPVERFVFGEWKIARVNIDYHVELDHHYYSVHHSLVGEQVDARLTATTVELFHKSQRVATHPRSYVRGRHTTTPEHMPRAHQKHLEWSPSRLARWAASVGPQTETLVQSIMADRPHPEQGYRSCLGILRLGRRYGDARLEAACARAVVVRARSYRHVESILKNGLDRAPLPDDAPSAEPAVRLQGHIRGRDYYS